MKYKGKVFEYFTHDGIKRVAVCQEIAFHKGLGKPIFIGVSPFGNVVKLTKEEIHKFI